MFARPNERPGLQWSAVGRKGERRICKQIHTEMSTAQCVIWSWSAFTATCDPWRFTQRGAGEVRCGYSELLDGSDSTF